MQLGRCSARWCCVKLYIRLTITVKLYVYLLFTYTSFILFSSHHSIIASYKKSYISLGEQGMWNVTIVDFSRTDPSSGAFWQCFCLSFWGSSNAGIHPPKTLWRKSNWHTDHIWQQKKVNFWVSPVPLCTPSSVLGGLL